MIMDKDVGTPGRIVKNILGDEERDDDVVEKLYGDE